MRSRVRPYDVVVAGGLALALWVGAAPSVWAFGFEGRPNWKGKRRPIAFVINMAHVPSTIAEAQYVAFLRDALKPWTQVESAAVEFNISEKTITDDTANRPKQDGVNMILWNSGAVPKDAMTWGRAFSFSDECDIVVELTPPFTMGNVRNTLTHEFGHCLGLAHSTAMASMARYSHYLSGLTHDDDVAVSILFPNDAHPLTKTTATLKGRVVTRGGDPVVGAVLSVKDPRSGKVVVSGFSGLVDSQRRRDASGAFDLPGVPAGESLQLLLWPTSMFGGIEDGHHGLPTKERPSFTAMTIPLPDLRPGDVKDLGKLLVDQ